MGPDLVECIHIWYCDSHAFIDAGRYNLFEHGKNGTAIRANQHGPNPFPVRAMGFGLYDHFTGVIPTPDTHRAAGDQPTLVIPFLKPIDIPLLADDPAGEGLAGVGINHVDPHARRFKGGGEQRSDPRRERQCARPQVWVNQANLDLILLGGEFANGRGQLVV